MFVCNWYKLICIECYFYYEVFFEELFVVVCKVGYFCCLVDFLLEFVIEFVGEGMILVICLYCGSFSFWLGILLLDEEDWLEERCCLVCFEIIFKECLEVFFDVEYCVFC